MLSVKKQDIFCLQNIKYPAFCGLIHYIRKQTFESNVYPSIFHLCDYSIQLFFYQKSKYFPWFEYWHSLDTQPMIIIIIPSKSKILQVNHKVKWSFALFIGRTLNRCPWIQVIIFVILAMFFKSLIRLLECSGKDLF